MQGECRAEETEILLRRREVLDRLCRSPAQVRDLVEETGQSRRTINRAINELEDAGLVERGENGIQATTAGRLARDRLAGFLSDLDDVLTAEDVLEPVPAKTDIAPEAVAGCEPILGTEPAPYRPLERLHEDLTNAERYRALVPTLDDPRTVRLLYEHVVTGDHPAELIVTPEVFETLREEFPRRMAAMADEEGFSVLVGEVPPFGISLFDRDVGSETTTTVHVVVLDRSGRVHGSIVNDASDAVDWAESQYATARSEATDRTNALTPDSDGGVRSLDPADGFTAAGRFTAVGQSLPVALEREGFVGVDASYFRDEPGADPPTAWRAGLSLVEVHTGYAIERVSPDFVDGSSPDEHRKLTTEITNELAAGTDCVVLGPPGSGKSTICKQVACGWYGTDRGPVLYRESDRGRSLASIDELVDTVATAEGHALVVVEDAVRPDADGIFEAVEQLCERDDVSVLLDARETEWRDRLELSVDGLEVVHVPALSETDCERLVDHFERTTGRPLGVPAEHLWATVRDEIPSGSEGGTNEMLRLVHRLATYADPLADGPTALEEAVAAVYEDLADDELALSVCTLVNALNAAGVAVDRGLLYAVADPGAFEAVDAALDWLEGRVLFPRKNGRYRTVHEEWSTAFLAHLVETEGAEAGARRFGTAVSAVLALADDPERCTQIRDHLGNPGALDRITTGPQRWADEVVEAVYDLCGRRSALAPLFGDGNTDSIGLPEACSDEIVVERPVRLGEAFLTGSYYDRAERAFERVSREDPDRTTERLLGLARVAFKRGAYDRAIAYHEDGLSIAREKDDLEAQARHFKGLGRTEWRLGSYERARECFETCHECARRLDDRELEWSAEANLGTIAWSRGAYDRASDHFAAFLDIARDVGDRHGEATSLNNLGSVAYHRGAYDRARNRFEESLAIRREIGYRSGEASCLNYLGFVASRRGKIREAEQFHEAALDITRTVDHPREQGRALRGLGIVAGARGDYDAAAASLREALSVFEETGNQSYMVRTELERARLAFEADNTMKARERAERGLEIAEELGERHVLGRCWKLLGRIAAVEGSPEKAREHWRATLELFEDRDSFDFALETLEHLVETCHNEGDVDGTRKWCRRAQTLLVDAPDATAELHREWVIPVATWKTIHDDPPVATWKTVYQKYERDLDRIHRP